MRILFIDTAFLIAFLRVKDSWHQVAKRLSEEFDRESGVRYATSHLVIAELLAHMSRGGPDARRVAADYVAGLLSRDDITIVPLTSELISRGLALYRQRPDKHYSLTDCVSMEICRDLNITEVLTSDTDFEHEGFHILLADD